MGKDILDRPLRRSLLGRMLGVGNWRIDDVPGSLLGEGALFGHNASVWAVLTEEEAERAWATVLDQEPEMEGQSRGLLAPYDERQVLVGPGVWAYRIA